MSLRVVITDLLTSECEMTGKADVECVRVQLEEGVPEAVIGTTEFLKLLRLKRKTSEKARRSEITVIKKGETP